MYEVIRDKYLTTLDELWKRVDIGIKAIQAAKIIILVSLNFNREFGKICFLYIILSIKLKL